MGGREGKLHTMVPEVSRGSVKSENRTEFLSASPWPRPISLSVSCSLLWTISGHMTVLDASALQILVWTRITWRAC